MDRITQQVYEAYPVTAKEKCCSMHRRKMEYKREAYRKRLVDEQSKKDIDISKVNEKAEISTGFARKER